MHPEPTCDSDPNVGASPQKGPQQKQHTQEQWSGQHGSPAEKNLQNLNQLPLPGTLEAAGPEPFEQIEARVVSELLTIKRSIQDPAKRRTEYKKLQARWHPDKNPQDPEVAKKIFQVIMHHKQEILGVSA